MTRKIHLILLLCFISLTASSAFAKQMSSQDRQKWLTEMRTYKHEFFTRELSLSKEQVSKFFPIYDEMEDKLNSISQQTRELERKTINDASASDLECEKAASAVFEQKKTEAEIELDYFDKFKTILSPRQLLNLKPTERKFVQQVVNYKKKKKTTTN